MSVNECEHYSLSNRNCYMVDFVLDLLYLLVAKRRFCVVMQLVVKKPNRPFDIWTCQSRKSTGVHMNDG